MSRELQRLDEQLADAGGECPLCQDRAAISHSPSTIGNSRRQRAQHAREPGPGEPGHDIIGDDDVEGAGARPRMRRVRRGLSENDTGS